MPDPRIDQFPITHEVSPHSPESELLTITSECINDNLSPQEAFSQIVVTTDHLDNPQTNENNIEVEDEELIRQEMNQLRQEMGLTSLKEADHGTPEISLVESFRSALGLNQEEIEKRNEKSREVLEVKYANNLSRAYDYTFTDLGSLEINQSDYQRRQDSFTRTIKNMSPVKRQLLKLERRKVISELKKRGIEDAQGLVQSMEDSASRFIYNPDYQKQRISYKRLLDRDNKPIPVVKELAKKFPDDQYDIVRKIEIRFDELHLNYHNYDRLDKFSDLLSLSPQDFDQYIAIEAAHPNARWISPNNREYLINKIQTNSLASEDLEKLDITLKMFSYNINSGLDSDLDTLKTNLKIVESIYLQESGKYWSKTNEYYKLLQDSVLKTCAPEEKANIDGIVNSGIEINTDYCYNQEKFNLKSDSELVLDCLNSENGPYFKAMIDLFDRPDLKNMVVLVKDLEYFKSEDGVKFLKLIKDIKPGFARDYLISVSHDLEDIIDNDGNCTEKLLRKIFNDGFGHRKEIAEFLLTPEKTKTLSENDQKFWVAFGKMVKEDVGGNYLDFIFQHRGNFDLYFNDKYQPTSLLLSSFLSFNRQLDYDWCEKSVIKSISDPEVIKSYSESDQIFWKRYYDIFQSHPEALKVRSFLVSNKEEMDKLFDSNGKPSFYFLNSLLYSYREKNESLIKFVNESAQNLPLVDKKYILSLGFIKDEGLHRCLRENRENFSENSLEIFLPVIKNASVNRAGTLFGEIIQSQYLDKDKRLLPPIGLCGWRNFNDYLKSHDLSPQSLTVDDFEIILEKTQKEVDKRIRQIDSSELDLPDGMRISVGTEIEVMLNGIFRTNEVSKQEIIDYKKSAESLKLRPSAFVEDYLNELSQKINNAKHLYRNEVYSVDYLGVGRGNDAVHEFANAPVKNTTVLLWELHEISKLGFIDFDRRLLQYIERGMHLTISGDKFGIRLDENAHLLQSALLASGWSTDALDAVGSSEIVDAVTDDSKKLYKQVKGFILERNRVKNPLFDDSRSAYGVENRAVRINSFNHLARTVDTFYRLAIPLKAYQDFIIDYGEDRSKKLLSDVEVSLNNSNSLSKLNSESQKLLPEVSDEKLRNSIITWAYFRNATVKNFAEKQKSISRYRLKSPLEAYNNRDMTRLGSELFEVFGGIADDGTKLDDALASYHQIPEADSLPEAERKLIGQVRKEIGTLFKRKRR